MLDGLEPGFLGGATGGGMKECNQVGLAVSVKEEVGLCVYLGWGISDWFGWLGLEVEAPEAMVVAHSSDYWLILVVYSYGRCVHVDCTTMICQ